MKDYQLALEYFQKALDKGIEIDNKNLIASINYEIGNIYIFSTYMTRKKL
jgi:hypothetical protein